MRDNEVARLSEDRVYVGFPLHRLARRLGADERQMAREVLAEFGYSEDEITALAENGVLVEKRRK